MTKRREPDAPEKRPDDATPARNAYDFAHLDTEVPRILTGFAICLGILVLLYFTGM